MGQLGYDGSMSTGVPVREDADQRFISRPLGLVRRGWTLRAPLHWWKEDATGAGLRRIDPDRILVCRVVIDDGAEFRRLTGRGSGKNFVVDTEVFWAGKADRQLQDWVFHNETTVQDPAEGEAIAKRMMAWLDRRSVQTLLTVSRSGPLSMSKLPKDEGLSAWDRLARLVIV